jgi:hypothetical protein
MTDYTKALADIERAQALNRIAMKFCTAVCTAALLFMTANVTLFAMNHGIRFWLATTFSLVVNGAFAFTLTFLDKTAPFDRTAPRWFSTLAYLTLGTVLLVNVWDAVFPLGDLSPAQLLLSAVPAALAYLTTGYAVSMRQSTGRREAEMRTKTDH